MAVDTKPLGIMALVALERYPTVPKPITVLVRAFAKKEVDTKSARLAVDTKPFGIMALVALERYPTVPNPMIVLVRFACVI